MAICTKCGERLWPGATNCGKCGTPASQVATPTVSGIGNNDAANLNHGAMGQSNGKPTMKVGTIGHAGHGKTTLSTAINMYCGMLYGDKVMNYDDIENVGCLEYQSNKRNYIHTDFKDTITGLAQMGGAILVVSGPDSIMPQTREHIILAHEANIPLIVFLNKLDLIDDHALLELVEEEIKDALTENGFPGGYKIPIIRGSAYCAMQDLEQGRKTKNTNCIIQLLDTMDTYS
jgi:elongation factor Tu